MELLTDELRSALLRNGKLTRECQIGGKDEPDFEPVVKFFTPDSNWTCYVVEGGPVIDDEKNQEIDFEFFGLVDGFEKEWGYFGLNELQSAVGPMGLKVERDLHFGNPTIKEVRSLQ